MNLLPPLAAFLTAALLLRLLLLPAARRWIMDHPNARSLHRSPVPRTGGVGLISGAALGVALAGGPQVAVILALALMLLSLVDDWRSLSAYLRLLVHVGAALVLVLAVAADASWLLRGALVLALAWMTNLYNFMDGADGLAGGMAVFGFGAFAVGAWMAGDAAFALACLSVAAASAAFLLFNFPPARMFMGDAGSVPLGFLAGAFALIGWLHEVWPWWFGPVVFAPFILDATAPLLRRAARGEKVWEAHRSHYYQRRVLMGWSHLQLVRFEYGLMLVTAAAALVAQRAPAPTQAVVLAVLGLAYLAIAVTTDLRWRTHREA